MLIERARQWAQVAHRVAQEVETTKGNSGHLILRFGAAGLPHLVLGKRLVPPHRWRFAIQSK